MKTATAALLLLCLPTVAHAEPPNTRPVRMFAGASLVGFIPRGDEQREVYTLGAGAGAEVGLAYRDIIRFTLSVTPSYSPGDPVEGPLASGASGRLWTVPMSAGVQFATTKWPQVRPYIGLGLTVEYLHETLAFSGPLGSREQARSFAPLGVHAQIGLEQNRPGRFFGELWFLDASAGGLDEGELAREVGGFQVRFGYRARL